MHARLHTIALTLLLLAGTAHAKDKPNVDQQILEELRGIREALTNIAAKLTPPPPPRARRSVDDFVGQGPDVAALEAIKEPDLSNKDDVRRYVKEIAAASRGQNSYSDRDPQVRLLKKVGPENLDVLLEILGRPSGGMGGYHLRAAINQMAKPEHKAMILAALPLQHELADAVLQNGWEQDARPILLDELRSNPDYLPQSWLQAITALKDPETYPLLLDFFVNGRSRWCTYDIIKDLPVTNMTDVVSQAWKNAQHDQVYERQAMARIAAGYGFKDALDLVVDSLEDDTESGSWNVREGRDTLLKVLDQRGSTDELVAWYKANRDQLTFDAARGKYVMPGSEKP